MLAVACQKFCWGHQYSSINQRCLYFFAYPIKTIFDTWFSNCRFDWQVTQGSGSNDINSWNPNFDALDYSGNVTQMISLVAPKNYGDYSLICTSLQFLGDDSLLCNSTRQNCTETKNQAAITIRVTANGNPDDPNGKSNDVRKNLVLKHIYYLRHLIH